MLTIYTYDINLGIVVCILYTFDNNFWIKNDFTIY